MAMGGLGRLDHNDKEHECTISRSMNTAAESAYGMGKMEKGVTYGAWHSMIEHG